MRARLLALVSFVALGAGPLAAQTPTDTRPVSPAPHAPRPAPPSQGAGGGWMDRGFLSINGAFQATTTDFADAFSFERYVEQASVDAQYDVDTGPAFDVSAGVRVWRSLAVGVGVTRFERTGDVSVSGSIPHPFFFDRDRAVGGLTGGIQREETAAHVSAIWAVPIGRMLVSFGAGPSWFSVKQGLATGLRIAEAYPFDEVSLDGVDTIEASGSAFGYNVYADVGFYFTRVIGVGADVRYSRASLALDDGDGRRPSVDVGGLQVGGGLRLRFPGRPASPPRVSGPGEYRTRIEPGPAGIVEPEDDRAGVVPPAPLKTDLPGWIPGFVPPAPPYVATVEMIVSDTGEVSSVRVLESSNRGYDYFLTSAIRNWRFTPARHGVRPVEYRKVVTIRMEPK